MRSILQIGKGVHRHTGVCESNVCPWEHRVWVCVRDIFTSCPLEGLEERRAISVTDTSSQATKGTGLEVAKLTVDSSVG